MNMDHIKTKLGSRRAILGVLVAVLGTLSASVAIAIASNSSSVPQGRPAPAPETQAPNVAIVSELSILNRPATAADSLPSGIVGNPSQWLNEQRVGANASLSRLAASSPSGSIYLIPSATGVCMFDTAGTTNVCASADEVANGEAEEAILCSPTIPSGDIEIGGVLPDGTSNPTVLLSNGSIQPLEVKSNTYSADFARSGPLPTSIEWIAGGTKHTTATHVPSSASSETCTTP
jgi:hypothetical protein